MPTTRFYIHINSNGKIMSKNDKLREIALDMAIRCKCNNVGGFSEQSSVTTQRATDFFTFLSGAPAVRKYKATRK
jgi:hypothetical protein